MLRAVLEENVDMVKLLQEKGASIHMVDIYKDTPLHYAAAKGNDQLVTFLLQKGADITAINEEGGTPLHAAAKSRNMKTALLLIELGANINIKDNNNCTPLNWDTEGLLEKYWKKKEEEVRQIQVYPSFWTVSPAPKEQGTGKR